MDREAWLVPVHGVTKCWTQLRDLTELISKFIDLNRLPLFSCVYADICQKATTLFQIILRLDKLHGPAANTPRLVQNKSNLLIVLELWYSPELLN